MSNPADTVRSAEISVADAESKAKAVAKELDASAKMFKKNAQAQEARKDQFRPANFLTNPRRWIRQRQVQIFVFGAAASAVLASLYAYDINKASVALYKKQHKQIQQLQSKLKEERELRRQVQLRVASQLTQHAELKHTLAPVLSAESLNALPQPE
ncbi:MAG: hypothetical protein MHM6MM_006164 [Cercozoa sp. M6MM]